VVLHRVYDDEGECHRERADTNLDYLIYFGMSHFDTYPGLPLLL